MGEQRGWGKNLYASSYTLLHLLCSPFVLSFSHSFKPPSIHRECSSTSAVFVSAEDVSADLKKNIAVVFVCARPEDTADKITFAAFAQQLQLT